MAAQASSQHTIQIDGEAVPLTVRRHPQARRLILRINESGDGAVVTIPTYARVRDGVEMAERKAVWIKHQLSKRQNDIAFADGVQVPYLGELHTVRHDPSGRGVRVEAGEIIVAGRIEHLPRRLSDWFKAQARAEIACRAHAKARDVNKRIARISIRDTRSRWGSCGAGGTLNFSWRLVLAPDHVLDYVVAHEVAHLIHRDHGEAFWAQTDQLCARMDEARDWLNAFGRDLHRYG